MIQRIGIVGCGAVVSYFYARQLPRIPGIQVVAVSDLDSERSKLVAGMLGCHAMAYGELLESVDTVVVATPPGSHRALAEAALRKGKDVWVEKPFVATRKDAVELTQLARDCGRRIFVGHFRRMFPGVRLLRELIQSGIMGPVLGMKMYEGGRFRWQSSSDYVSRDPLGGVLLDTGSHTLDMAMYASGFDRVEVKVEIVDVVRDRVEPAHQVDARFGLHVEGRRIGCRLKVSRHETLANKLRIECQNGWVECGMMPGTSVRLGGIGGTTVVRPKEEILGDQECFRRQCEAILLDKATDVLGGHLFINQVGILESVLSYGASK